MAHLATPALLRRLKSLYPVGNAVDQTDVQKVVNNAWYLLAGVAFNGSNKPEAVPSSSNSSWTS